MGRALTLTSFLYLSGAAIIYLGPILPVAAQDPEALFGTDKVPKAAGPSKAAPAAKIVPAGKKAPAAKPAAATQAKTPPTHTKAAAAAQAKPVAMQAMPAEIKAKPLTMQAMPEAVSPPKAATASHTKPAAVHVKRAAAPIKLAPAEATAASAANLGETAAPAASAASTAQPVEPPKAEVAPSANAGALPVSKPTAKAAPVQHSAAPAPAPVRRRPAGPPPASPAMVRAFCGKLWNKIQNNWELASGKNHVILGVDVDASGNVIGTKVSSQPKNGDAEAKAQEALTKSQPLEALPTGLPSAHLTITFDSMADPHGDSNSGGSVRLEYNPAAPINTAAPVSPASPSTPAAPSTAQ